MRWRRKFDGNNSLSRYVGTRASGRCQTFSRSSGSFFFLVFPPLNVCGLKLLTALLVALLLFGLACRTRLHLFLQALVLAPLCYNRPRYVRGVIQHGICQSIRSTCHGFLNCRRSTTRRQGLNMSRKRTRNGGSRPRTSSFLDLGTWPPGDHFPWNNFGPPYPSGPERTRLPRWTVSRCEDDLSPAAC